MASRLHSWLKSLTGPSSQSARGPFTRDNGQFIPVGSFPFLSGDTFRSMAGHFVGPDGILSLRGFNAHVVFAEADRIDQEHLLPTLLTLRDDLGGVPISLIVHNRDKVPTPETVSYLASELGRVFCVNLQDGVPGATPLPIGVQNMKKWSHSKPHYLEQLATSSPGNSLRQRTVLSSFNPGTNPSVREPLIQSLRRSRHGFQGTKWKSGEYRSALLDTKFVISPPGNGPDCWRTWESIYAGAVPVVLRGTLAQSIIDELPILPVENYDDFLGLSDEELTRIYSELFAGPLSQAAWAPWWYRRIMGESN